MTTLHQPDPVLVRELTALLSPNRVLSRPIDRLGRSADASIYRMIPEVVVRPSTDEEVAALLAYATEHGRHVTFRAAGTSLSGQAVTDDILVELAPFWKRFEVLDAGTRVRSQPGVVLGHINRHLARFRRGLGPDPASVEAAMVGGVLANNASGMCCGVRQNSYQTLESVRLVLADGTVVDTARPDADPHLRACRPDLHAALLALRDEVRADTGLASRIRRKFQAKNTTGYSLNALLDFDSPAEILAHLMVGSEGTLGFVAEATLRTVPEPPFRATGLLFFEALTEAGTAVGPLAALEAAAVEIMDAASLRSQQEDREYPFPIGDQTAALLVELRAEDESGLGDRMVAVEAALRRFRLLTPPRFSRDPAERERHWRLRKGLFPAVGAVRPVGTSVVIEDVAVPVPRLAEAIADLQELFVRHRYPEAIVFGHAKDGNLHFVVAQDFGRQEAVDGYAAFMQELVSLVVDKYDGALKAEHGSGRNMAPFVRTEWGDRAYEVMHKIKALLDPHGVLNPGVVLNDDPKAHLRHLKPLTAVSSTVDRCIECGFCEPRCPSRELTLSPRQRIVVARELERLAGLGTPEAGAVRRSLERDFVYEGLETCAVDAMCQTSCPVKIDTGALVKQRRLATHGPLARRLAGVTARRFATTAWAARAGLAAAHRLRASPGGARLVALATGALHAVAPSLLPRLPPSLDLPSAAPPLPPVHPAPASHRVVYFPSCLTRVLGPDPGEAGLAEVTLETLATAGFEVRYPEPLGSLCCGMPFASKGFPEAAERAATATLEALWRASREGLDPVVTDTSPCGGTLHEARRLLGERGARLRIMDFSTFWACEVLPNLGATRKRPGVSVLHPTCTLVKAGGLPDLLSVAQAHAERVVVPIAAECCGFAGDRGFLVPELTKSATLAEAEEVRALAEAGAGLYSTCRTCELGMSRAVGHRYRSVVHLVRESLLR